MSLTPEDYEIGKNDLYKAIQHLTFYLERFHPDGVEGTFTQRRKMTFMNDLYREYFEICDEMDRQKELDERREKNESK